MALPAFLVPSSIIVDKAAPESKFLTVRNFASPCTAVSCTYIGGIIGTPSDIRSRRAHPRAQQQGRNRALLSDGDRPEHPSALRPSAGPGRAKLPLSPILGLFCLLRCSVRG